MSFNFKCAKCKTKKAEFIIPFGKVPELRHIGRGMDRYRALCGECKRAMGK